MPLNARQESFVGLMKKSVDHAARGFELLSKREEDVVRCVAEGLTNREIAKELGLRENTVKNYLFRIFDKLGISNRVELILYASGNTAPRLAAPGAAATAKMTF